MGNLACPLDSGHPAMAAIEAKQVAREKDGWQPVLFAFYVRVFSIPAVFILSCFRRCVKSIGVVFLICYHSTRPSAVASIRYHQQTRF